MKLPDRIPKRLRALALFLPEFDDGEGAWFKADALEVIESLAGTTVVVSEVVILNRAPFGYAASDSALSVERYPNEADADYAGRSRSLARDFIKRAEIIDDNTLFALTFPLWKDAA